MTEGFRKQGAEISKVRKNWTDEARAASRQRTALAMVPDGEWGACVGLQACDALHGIWSRKGLG